MAAGNPILAEENIEDHLNVPFNLFRPSADYFLRVHGDSMKDAGILDGDLLAVHKTGEAKNGDMVVARIGDDVTVKTFRRDRRKYLVHLEPENPAYTAITVDLRSEPFAIEGLGGGVIRR